MPLLLIGTKFDLKNDFVPILEYFVDRKHILLYNENTSFRRWPHW